MKLLKLEIGNLGKEKQFRSLHSGFQVLFHTLDQKGRDNLYSFRPFCFAGLNGSGKSNVLEAIAAIFYHVECCVAKFKPIFFNTNFSPDECDPDAFTIEYLIGRPNEREYVLENLDKITITKEVGKPPKMFRQRYPFGSDQEIIEESLEPPVTKSSPEPAPGKIYLPDLVVGYSSGENEILSLPFIKSRLIHLDEYKEAAINKFHYSEPETSLVYIDDEMSQAVLLANLLFEDSETTLKPLEVELGILGLASFRINLSVPLKFDFKHLKQQLPLLYLLDSKIQDLKNCATCWYSVIENETRVLILDFLITSDTKAAFQTHFDDSLHLFRFFQVLYELNAITIDEGIKEEVYKSKGFYTDWKIPKPSPEESVFFFENYYIRKAVRKNLSINLLLREFSDGEHQFLHSMGICLMLKNRRSLLLLDEPETHFNPGWRAKFIMVLKDSIKAGGGNNMLKDILLTSHSPFIISDCRPENVIIFKRDKKRKVYTNTASQCGFNTYGASVELILQEIFGLEHSISAEALNEIRDLLKGENTATEIIEGSKQFGDSYEKGFLFERIEELKAKGKK